MSYHSFLILFSLTEKLANTERHLDVSKGHSQTAADRTDELKQLNRSIFRPVITFNKDAKRAAKQAEIQRRYEDERSERERGMMDIRETQNRLGRAATYGRGYEDEDDITSGGVGGGSGRYKTEAQLAARKEQRKRYQFEATASDDEMEDELDDNLDEISEMTKRLKALGSAMGQELDTQNSRIDRIEGKTVNLDQKIFTNTERVSYLDLTFPLYPSLTIPIAQAHQVSSGPLAKRPMHGTAQTFINNTLALSSLLIQTDWTHLPCVFIP